MRPPDRNRASQIRQQLLRFDSEVLHLPGLSPADHIDCLVEQLVDSLRRVEYVFRVRDGNHDSRRTDPSSDLFDPLKAAVLHHRRGNVDEAFWLVFLATHFGKSAESNWRLVADVYGRLGGEEHWDWTTISACPGSFRDWLGANLHLLKGKGRRFSNHRKYQSLRAEAKNGLAAVVESYVAWISPPRTHQALIRQIHERVGQNPKEVFEVLYQSMSAVRQFGRLGRFDYLTMLSKLGLAPIEAGSAYIGEGTGPLRGARLLFAGSAEDKRLDRELDDRALQLESHLMVGMQVIEDAICNWQKSPHRFVSFNG
ncbi:MAG: hypothetical protein ACKVP3_24105 [Hyphomicrobiaceae bacterium]